MGALLPDKDHAPLSYDSGQHGNWTCMCNLLASFVWTCSPNQVSEENNFHLKTKETWEISGIISMSSWVHRWFQQNFPLMKTETGREPRRWRGMRWTGGGGEDEEDDVAVCQFQSATVDWAWLYLVVTAQVGLAHTDPLYRHGDADQGQLVCKRGRTLDRQESYFQDVSLVAFSWLN